MEPTEKYLLPRIGPTKRLQVYPSLEEVIFLKTILFKTSNVQKDTNLIRIMINFFMDNTETTGKLINYANNVRLKYDSNFSKKEAKELSLIKVNELKKKEVLQEAERVIRLLTELNQDKKF